MPKAVCKAYIRWWQCQDSGFFFSVPMIYFLREWIRMAMCLTCSFAGHSSSHPQQTIQWPPGLHTACWGGSPSGPSWLSLCPTHRWPVVGTITTNTQKDFTWSGFICSPRPLVSKCLPSAHISFVKRPLVGSRFRRGSVQVIGYVWIFQMHVQQGPCETWYALVFPFWRVRNIAIETQIVHAFKYKRMKHHNMICHKHLSLNNTYNVFYCFPTACFTRLYIQ